MTQSCQYQKSRARAEKSTGKTNLPGQQEQRAAKPTRHRAGLMQIAGSARRPTSRQAEPPCQQGTSRLRPPTRLSSPLLAASRRLLILLSQPVPHHPDPIANLGRTRLSRITRLSFVHAQGLTPTMPFYPWGVSRRESEGGCSSAPTAAQATLSRGT